MKETIQNYLTSKNAKLYGDRMIGFRAQLEDGGYEDDEFKELFEKLTYIDDDYGYDHDLIIEFNEVCF